MVFAIHQHKLATGIHVSCPSWAPSHLPPHSVPLGCPRAPALNALLYASNSHWLSVSRMVIICLSTISSNHPTLSFSHCVQNVCCFKLLHFLFVDYIKQLILGNWNKKMISYSSSKWKFLKEKNCSDKIKHNSYHLRIACQKEYVLSAENTTRKSRFGHVGTKMELWESFFFSKLLVRIFWVCLC